MNEYVRRSILVSCCLLLLFSNFIMDEKYLMIENALHMYVCMYMQCLLCYKTLQIDKESLNIKYVIPYLFSPKIASVKLFSPYKTFNSIFKTCLVFLYKKYTIEIFC